jgi:hypothetical protein
MHSALRSSLAVVAIVACAGCQTHDRRIYTVRRDKNLHTPDPWSATSTTKAADEATAPIGGPPGTATVVPPPEDNSGADTGGGASAPMPAQ